MQIKRFRVSGYKNFARALELDDLTDFTIIHGPNNVGKSNLLEALGLPFWLFSLQVFPDRPTSAETLKRKTLIEAGYPAADMFNIEQPCPVEIELEINLTAGDLPPSEYSGDPGLIAIALRIDPGPPDITWHFTRFQIDDTDALGRTDPQTKTGAIQLAASIAQRYSVGGGLGQRHFQVVNNGLLTRAEVPQELCLALYDAQESRDRTVHMQWKIFADLMRKFKGNTGTSTVTAVYDRRASVADLLFEMEGYRIPMHLLGTGIQQLATVLGTLVTSGASVVGIEEPEANLSFELQILLRETLRELVQDGRGGPNQLFLTSHSPQFQIGPNFYYLEAGSPGPTIHPLPAARNRSVTGPPLEPSTDDSAPVSWVTPEGLVQLPPSVIEAMELENGGGVGFIKAEPGFQMLTNAQFVQEWESSTDE